MVHTGEEAVDADEPAPAEDDAPAGAGVVVPSVVAPGIVVPGVVDVVPDRPPLDGEQAALAACPLETGDTAPLGLPGSPLRP